MKYSKVAKYLVSGLDELSDMYDDEQSAKKTNNFDSDGDDSEYKISNIEKIQSLIINFRQCRVASVSSYCVLHRC